MAREDDENEIGNNDDLEVGFNFQEVVVDDVSGVDSFEKDNDYMPDENEEYTDNKIEDDKVESDA